MQAKRLLGVLVGSCDSADHQISIEEGEQVAKIIEDFGKYETCLVEVGNSHWQVHWDGGMATIDKDKFCAVVKKKRVKPDVVLILTKGKFGESGEIQSYFDSMKIPYTFSGVEETKLTFNKYQCSKLLKEEGLPVVKSVLIENRKMVTDDLFDRLEKECGYPFVVKPNKGSGCHGVTKVNSRKQVEEAVDLAFRDDSQVVVEPSVQDGMEVTCTVHDITSDGLLEAFPVTEITHNGEIFHTGASDSKLTTPAKNIREEVVQQVIKVAKVAYRALNLSGLATFDMIVQDDLPVLLEVNSVPQIGPNSMVVKQVKVGLSFQWQRNVAKFYTTIVDHSITNFPNILANKKICEGRGV